MITPTGNRAHNRSCQLTRHPLGSAEPVTSDQGRGEIYREHADGGGPPPAKARRETAIGKPEGHDPVLLRDIRRGIPIASVLERRPQGFSKPTVGSRPSMRAIKARPISTRTANKELARQNGTSTATKAVKARSMAASCITRTERPGSRPSAISLWYG